MLPDSDDILSLLCCLCDRCLFLQSCVRTFSAFDAQRTGRITLDFGQVGKQERIYETKDGAGLLFHLMRSAQGDDPRLRPGEKSGRNGGKQQG
eukprot:scaffold36898_cov21-Tisochrysis_lutea.AAC.2